ncbi:MAG: hypothetical protein HYR56_27630 [Acidobacteria bacterium]|nr:hypothetical protein [Acidobacteriota bacterium]MBI3423473.1 hypothetical protein [Acidobacteriota bacterium]
MNNHHDQATQNMQVKQTWRTACWLGLLGCITLSLSLSGALWPTAHAIQNARVVRVANASAAPGSTATVAVELVAQGNENALSFSLSFNPAVLTNPVVTAGNGAPNLSLVPNPNQVASGRLGLIISLPAGQSFAAGTRQLANVAFAIPANAPTGATTVDFGSQPIGREISDPNANELTATYTSGTVTVQSGQSNPVPTLASVSPNSTTAGNAAFTLAVTGTNFVNGATVRWNGADRPTTFGSATQLTAAIPATDVAAAGTAQVTVFNPAPGGGVSSAVPFTINGLTVSVSAASFARDIVAAEMIVAMFGVDLATDIKVGETVPLPTTLAGTTVTIRDSAGVQRTAPLFFVSPGQINYLVPAGLAAGTATLTVTTSNNKVSTGTLNVQAVAPGLFAANANGAGVPAAVLFRQKANGQQSLEELIQAQAGTLVPKPIDLGPDGDIVLVIAFGTGIRGRSNAASAVTCTLGGTPIDVPFASAQGGLVGLDQLNLGPLPRSLAGRGNVNLVITVDGKAANTMQLNIK